MQCSIALFVLIKVFFEVYTHTYMTRHLCNDLLMGLYTRNAIVRIIDSGYSYRKTTDIVGGEFIDFANDDLDISINPFTNIVDIDEQYGGIETILEYMAAPKEGLTDYQLSKLQQYVLIFIKCYNRGYSTVKNDVIVLNNNDFTQTHNSLILKLLPVTY